MLDTSSSEESQRLRRECAVHIVEQPAAKLQRFRYASEVDGSRSVGSIPGENSTAERKTYPTIRVSGYNGPMAVMVSLINPEDKLVHPHAIIGNDPRYHCKYGVIYAFVEGPEVVFNNVGVLCVRSKTEEDVTAALQMRREYKLDPFKAGFPHITDHRRINFSAVRLCFTVFIPEEEIKPADRKMLSKYNIDLKPVASCVVYDAKKLSDLKIHYINKSVGSMLGGTEMVLLCEKYSGVNPEVVFVEGDWEEKAEVKMYHKQMALVIVTPPYRDPTCTRHVPVEVYLQRRGPRGAPERSAPASSEYIPALPKSHPSEVGIKRPPPDYIKSKQSKRPFVERLSRYGDDVQRTIAELLGEPPSIFQESPSVSGLGQSTAPVQRAADYWQPHPTIGTPNPLNQQEFANVDNFTQNMYTGLNNVVSNLYTDSSPPIMVSYENSMGPIMPSVYSVATNTTALGYQIQNGPSTSFIPDNSDMFTHLPSKTPSYNFLAMQTDFSTNVPHDGANVCNVSPLPNIITTASSSNNQIPNMPDVLLPMSPESLNIDTKFNLPNVEINAFNMANAYIDELIVDPDIPEYMKSIDTFGVPGTDTGAFPTYDQSNLNLENFGGYAIDQKSLTDKLRNAATSVPGTQVAGPTFDQINLNVFDSYDYDPESLSDELKKMGL